MAKVIIFSRTFPVYHLKKGTNTFFVEQILNSILPIEANGIIDRNKINKEVLPIINDFVLLDGYYKKHHTIRKGSRWKIGDKFSPRVWSEKPYKSKMITIAPDIEIKKIWDFEIINYQIFINGKLFYHQHVSEWHSDIEKLAKNDGLSMWDMFEWFKIPNVFKGQIICWNENVNY